MLRVQVTWPNAHSPLLPESGSSVELFADGAALSPTSSSPGLRVFDVPDGTAELELKAAFTASFGAVNGRATDRSGTVDAPAMSAEVLRAEQKYSVAGAQLTAQPISDYGGPHPLVVTKGAANKNGVVAITLRTEFVDIGPFWEKYSAFWDYYLAEHKPNTTTYVLGFTGGMPIVWLAIVPDGLASYSNGFTSCLVFYRPANYTYSRLDQPHDAVAIPRYFLKPKPDSDASAAMHERDHANPPSTPPGPYDGYHLMRCRFEDALDSSKRALVMLHPWPSGTGFGVATTSSLPSVCEGAIRLLRTKKVLCKGVAKVELGRLGISGFSRGGDALWAALRNNMVKVGEVYAFDCTSSDRAQGEVVQWFNSHDMACLRLVGGVNNVTLYNAIKRTISPSGAPRAGLTVTPASLAAYDPGNNVVWDHYVSLLQNLREELARRDPRALKGLDDDLRHQFAICGGWMPPWEPGPYDLDGVETFLQNFLSASNFNHL